MHALRDAVMLAMLPALYQQQPRRSPRELVAEAYDFADEVLYQRAIAASHSPWVAPEALDVPSGRLGTEGCIAGYKSHRWNAVTKLCDRCRAEPANAKQKHAAQRAFRQAQRARQTVLKEVI